MNLELHFVYGGVDPYWVIAWRDAFFDKIETRGCTQTQANILNKWFQNNSLIFIYLAYLVPHLENCLSTELMPCASLLALSTSFGTVHPDIPQNRSLLGSETDSVVLLKHKRDSALERKCCLHCAFCIVGRRSSSLLVHGTFCSTKTDTCMWSWLERNNNNNVTHLVLTALLETRWFITRLNMSKVVYMCRLSNSTTKTTPGFHYPAIMKHHSHDWQHLPRKVNIPRLCQDRTIKCC